MRVLVTGGANGIGRAAAEELLEEGHNVKVYDRDAEALQELPEGMEGYVGDVRDGERVEEVMGEAEFDVLVNDAGYQAMGAVEDMPVEEARKHFETNVLGTWNVTREALPTLREREGRIVNVSSLAGRVAAPFLAAYCSSKHAVEGFSDSLRRELMGTGVDVVVVEPGPVRTGFNEDGRSRLEEYLPESFYSEVYRRILRKPVTGVSPERAGKVVARAATETRPRTRYTVTWQAWLAPKLQKLVPTRLMDVIARRAQT
ncbi:MAG: SDR family oxidoreductase [Candidatus Nanohaloarchaea archaeon]|nr:SDR family oxidoreductase [Candidatus Nanohaloarchaea archaeon]